jgi:hypothetical protein
MSARSTPAPTGVQAQPVGTPDKALRRLRQLCIALAVVCAAALPFELGVLPTSHLTAGARAKPHPTLRILSVNNDPRTAVVGRTETFSVRLAGVSHTWLTYVLRYPDGHAERVPVRTDRHGSSSYTFRVRPYAARHVCEVATLSIEDTSGRVLAFTHFAIQSPLRPTQATRTATSTPHPAITAIRGFSLFPSAGAGFSSIAVSGSGFTPDGPITLTFDGRRVATSCTADATGSFSYCAFTIPAVAAGTHTVTASDSKANVAAARFTT